MPLFPCTDNYAPLFRYVQIYESVARVMRFRAGVRGPARMCVAAGERRAVREFMFVIASGHGTQTKHPMGYVGKIR